MKNLFFIIIFSLSIINNSHSEEIIDCSKFEKLKAKLDCKAKNIKTWLNKGQSKVKEKISNPGDTKTGNEFKKSKLGNALIKLKNSKTGAEFQNKE